MQKMSIGDKEFWLIPAHVNVRDFYVTLEEVELTESTYLELSELKKRTLGQVFSMTETEVQHLTDDTRKEVEILFGEFGVDISKNDPLKN